VLGNCLGKSTIFLREDSSIKPGTVQESARTPRFVKTAGGKPSLDEASLARGRQLTGLKGYVTNIPASIMAAGEIIGSYRNLWHVEQSSRPSSVVQRSQAACTVHHAYIESADHVESPAVAKTALLVDPQATVTSSPLDW
jgi:hypothetical protein